MAYCYCPDCGHHFDPTNHLVDAGSATAGATAGGMLGARIGIAAGPLGAIAGTIPGAIIGGLFGWLGSSKVARCPRCREVFTL